jgi:glucose/mannose-6-phosphate isomerase
LNFICSHSGNTEETIASFEEALAHNLPVVGVASGGKVEEMCKAHGIPFVKLPIPFPNFQPRMATAHFVSVIHTVLKNSGIIEGDLAGLLSAGKYLETKVPAMEEKGREIAGRLVGKTPVIFSNTRFKSLAMIWKIKMNENAKTPAFWNYFPELNHNEMVGYSLPQAKFCAILLREPGDYPMVLRRYEITAKLLEEKGVETMTLDIEGETVYDKVFGTLALGDWASYHLALRYGIDPTPVDMVEDLKRMLRD